MFRNKTYDLVNCATFCKTKDRFGGLSNMAGGFPLIVNEIPIRTSEALYQACRFPDHPEVQAEIIKQASPMAAKLVIKPFVHLTRDDWIDVRVDVMRWALSVKLLQSFVSFGDLLVSTNNLPIVELSMKDDFWGAKPQRDGTLVGQNVLGCLLTELREMFSEDPFPLLFVDPLVDGMRLMGEEIERISLVM